MSKEKIIKSYSKLSFDVLNKRRTTYNKIITRGLRNIKESLINDLEKQLGNHQLGCREAIKIHYKYDKIYCDFLLNCCDMFDAAVYFQKKLNALRNFNDMLSDQ